MLSSLAAHHLYHHLDSQKIFEEMDRAQLEELFLEHQENEEHIFEKRQIWMGIAGILGGTAFFAPRKLGFGAFFGAGITVVGGTVAVVWWRWKLSEVKKAIGQMERTKMALRRRRQVYFSISNRLPPSRNPLILRACRLTVQSIDILILETKSMTSSLTWSDLYTPEMLQITEKNGGKLKIEEETDENFDFDVVFESLIAMFKLHISEYFRLLIAGILRKNTNFWKFLQVVKVLKENRRRFEEIEKLALKGKAGAENRQKSIEKREKVKILELGWKEQISMAMEAILEGLETGNLNRNEVELALRRALLIVGSSESTTSSDENSTKLKENSENLEKIQNEDVKVFEKGEPTDVDMVFEGISLSEAEKRSGIARDVLLDGSEAKKHEKSLFGELKMVLEPRRNDFQRREKKALAKFYGVDEEELEEKAEENFEGVGQGDDSEELEPYDWRKEAENCEGLHQESENIDFLNALASRRVQDDVIE